MRRTILLLVLSWAGSALFADLADSGLNAALAAIFPELRAGYVDLNGNGKPDRTEDLDEMIPDAGVKDGVLQSREILAFIVGNYELIPVASLRRVVAVLDKPEGAFSELVSLEYRRRVEEAVRMKVELDARGLFLTASARREAAERMSGYLATMVSAYGKETRSLEPQFVSARDELFSMIERGYPLPENMGADNAAILQSIMVNTVLRERGGSPARVNAAIKTLGRLKVAPATGYLLELLSDPELKRAAIAALGEIGSAEALSALLGELGRKNDLATRIELIRAIGRVGDRESIARLQELLKSDAAGSPDPEVVVVVMESLVSIVKRGSPDPSMLGTFTEYVSSPVTRLRVLAVEGLARFPQNPKVPDILFPLLSERQPEDVAIAAIRAVNALQSPRTVPALIGLLRSPEASDAERQAAIEALGTNANGVQALANVVAALESPSESVGRSAADALVALYRKQPDQVVGSVGRSLARSADLATLVRGTEVLSRLADPASLSYLAPLLSSPHAQVKANVTWALYRIRSSANLKILEDLKTLVKSETEALGVRINAVRALGAIRHDSAQLKVWEVLATTTRMTGEKYTMLRYYAVRALGELGAGRDEVIDALLRIAGRDTNPEMVKEAVRSLQSLATANPAVEEALVRAFRRSEDLEVRTRVVEALGDMGSAAAVELSPALLTAEIEPSLKKRAIAALARVRSSEALALVLDAARDERAAAFVKGVLEDADRSILRGVLSGRAKTETNPQVSTVIQELLDQIEDSL